MNANLKWFSCFLVLALILLSLFSLTVTNKAQANDPLPPPCLPTVYVNGTTGSDTLYDGSSPIYTTGSVGPLQTIQAGIGAVCVGGTVNVAIGIYNLTDYLDINKSLNLVGAGKDSTIINGSSDPNDEVIGIYSSNTHVLISDFTIQNGNYYGIYVEDTSNSIITINDCTITHNNSRDFGGGVGIVGQFAISEGVAGGEGFGPVGNSIVTMNRCIVTNNTVIATDNGIQSPQSHHSTHRNLGAGVEEDGTPGFGGGIAALSCTLNLNQCTISNNTATVGGGIFAANDTTLNMNGCTATGNQADLWGGGICYAFTSGDQARATIISCNITNNLADRAGGGLFILAAGLYNLYPGNQSAINNDKVPGDSGTLNNLSGFISQSQQFAFASLDQPLTRAVTLYNCNVTNNEAARWGGGMASFDSTYALTGCTFSGNAASRLGGGIGTFLTWGELVNCTISGNNLEGFAGLLNSSNPAGDGASSTATNAGGGMGLLVSYTRFECNTIANNATGSDSNSYGGGLFNSIFSESHFVNTIVANNTAGQTITNNCRNGGTIISLGHNIDSLNQCGFNAAGDQVNTNPLLGPLQDNGGPTYTCAIGADSPAFNKGDNSGAPATDQRGVPRPQGPYVDIGAYEAIISTITIINPAVINGNPASGMQGQCPMTVVITGTNLSGTTSVSFGPGITVISFTVNSDTQITATICIDANAAPGARNVSVTTPAGTWTGTALFTVVSQSIGTGSHGSSLTGSVSLSPPVTNPIILTSSASLSAKSVAPGTPVTVTADITNKSAVNGSKKVTLYVNGQVESTQGVTVNSGGSTKLTFNVSRSEPGDYSVYVDGIPAGSFKVELFRESDGILILSATLVALAFLIGIVMLWRRQRTGSN